MTNSKEALDNLVHCKSITRCKECRHKSLCTMERDFNIIKQDLDRLEELEKEHNKLKERYKHRAETSNDLCKAVRQYEKAIEILVNKRVNILILKYCIEKGCGIDTYNFYYTTEEQLTQEEYELLKGVLNNGR